MERVQPEHPNFAYQFEWNADGFKSEDQIIREGCISFSLSDRSDARRSEQSRPSGVLDVSWLHSCANWDARCSVRVIPWASGVGADKSLVWYYASKNYEVRGELAPIHR